MRRRARPSAPARQLCLVGVALCLFPALVMAVVLAPEVVRVEREVALDDTGLSPAIAPLSPEPAFQWLPIPRDSLTGFFPELTDLERRFAGSWGGVSPNAKRLARLLLAFPRNHGDTIVLDDTDRRLRDPVFRDALAITSRPLPIPVIDADPFGVPFLSDVSPGYVEFGNGGPNTGGTTEAPPVIPEPGTGALLGLGLSMLAFRRRAQRRARARTSP